MNNSGLTAMVFRFLMGTLAAVAVGYLVFRQNLFLIGTRPFQCVAVGALMAAMIALVRAGRSRRALALVGAFALLQTGLAWQYGWPRAFASSASNLFVAAGIFLVAVIFDLLAVRGFRLGKFLVVGPLLGGVYLAISPLAGWGAFARGDLFRQLFENLWLGILIGDAVALGVELAELVPGLYPSHSSEPEVTGRSASESPS